MRIRQVRQDFWTDEKVARMTDAVRLFYIGLWCVADDMGWFRWDASRIGALLYPFKPAGRRERDIDSWAAILVESGRLILHDCGCASIPTLPRHQVIGGTKSRGEYERHLRHLPEPPDIPGVPDIPPGRVGNVTVGNGNRARKREDETASEFKARVGRPTFMGGDA